MKKLLTFVLALVAVVVFTSPGVAQPERQEQPGGALRIRQPSAQLIEQLAGLEGEPNPTAIDRATNVADVPAVSEAMPAKDCRCVASKGGWNSGIVYDYGVIATYPLLDVFAPRKCSQACSDKVSGKVNIGDATALCAKVNWSGGCVHGYGYIGYIGTDNVDGTAGNLICTAPVAAVTQQKCPAGWMCNACSPQVEGGITGDGKCKKAACGPNSIAPYPPDGTQIGSWGFSWGNAFYAWGNSANGGSPVTIIVSPATPGSGSWGTCP